MLPSVQILPQGISGARTTPIWSVKYGQMERILPQGISGARTTPEFHSAIWSAGHQILPQGISGARTTMVKLLTVSFCDFTTGNKWC